MQADLKEWAVRYATAGFPVFPCEITEKSPITHHGFKDATIDVKQVERWWTRYPKALIGMPTEGWFVLDVDPRKNGLETLEALQEEITLPKTPMVISGGGGKHFYFRATGLVRHCIARMTFEASKYLTNSTFEAMYMNVWRRIYNLPNHAIRQRDLHLVMKELRPKERDEVLQVLRTQNRLVEANIPTRGRPASGWKAV